MNAQVAASERVENSDRPQMPWPLVQPEPRTVPTPTMSPPAIIVRGPPANVIEEVSKKNNPEKTVPISMPIMKIRRQLNSASNFEVRSSGKYAGCAEDASVGRHQEHGGKANERST